MCNRRSDGTPFYPEVSDETDRWSGLFITVHHSNFQQIPLRIRLQVPTPLRQVFVAHTGNDLPLLRYNHRLFLTAGRNSEVIRGQSLLYKVVDRFHLHIRKVDRKSTRLNSSHVAISYAV